ncbi:CmpA/NrtA family ABC transporter substrate-binding protein [Rubellicoccus peritrichatus]|uniref:CmpA/NrtA family ABC transporter substrate-binding protein n=1 Tax=Rubellicoccus peritrichatus TaxID=3080537 RepID=A0AAQ3QUS6_9BACT|nr:CmpA/NrtA family ABC transporter substrate-binding protein [Puniceicoccus sp. CR14]WOO40230.1 CmpA/NrtA family ABC transporter substrate-binding protein [Puniceicoccus sp. CR14]
MSNIKDPFDPNQNIWDECGETTDSDSRPDHFIDMLESPMERENQSFLNKRAQESGDGVGLSRALEGSVLKSIFKTDLNRRRFLKGVGSATAFGILSQFIPIQSLHAMAEDAKSKIEKKKLKIGFVPITCATPIIAGHALGFYDKYGLEVDIIKTAGWAVARDKCMNGEYDASHLLAPMPAAMSLGLGSAAQDWRMVTNVNTNGQAIVLANKHKNRQDPSTWKGMKFGVPFEYSMHNLLLRLYVAEHGIDPDKDIQIRVVPPPEMVANLRAENVDGYLAPDPFNQRAVYDGVGFIHKLTKDIWDQHPCCCFGISQQFIDENPNTFIVLLTAILDATATAERSDQRVRFAESMAPRNYLNQPSAVLKQILTGVYPDGQGNIKKVPDRISFMPFPSQSMGTWILGQMRRWDYIKDDVDYKGISDEIFMSADVKKRMLEMANHNKNLNWTDIPDTKYPVYDVYGKDFDPNQINEYIDTFEITRSI